MKKISLLVFGMLLLAVAFLVAPVAADTIELNLGNSQSATVGTAVTILPSVIVRNGTEVLSGVNVTFAVDSGGGSITGATATTNAYGIATVGSWTLGTTAGTNTLTAASGSLSTFTFTATGTAATSAPTISSVIPSSGINNGYVNGVDIYGSGFVTNAIVRLVKSGQTNISIANVNYTSTDIVGSFNINGATAGAWDVVVINPDNGIVTRSGGFTVVNSSDASTVTAISPSSATVNTTVSTTITGTGFQSNARMRLARSGYNDILGSVSSTASTSIVGTFDLTSQAPGSWNACVLYDGTTRVCGPAFTINPLVSTANGSINVKSSPSLSKILLNNVLMGGTPMTLDNITPGTYTVLIRHADYNDYSESVTVTAGNISYVTASLVLSPEVTTATVTAPKTTVTTVKTTAKSTVKAPTPWPTNTPTQPSPLGIESGIIATIGTVLLVMRRK